MEYRNGIGYDVHRFSESRPLVLGGVTVPYERGLEGHSDADVLTHAIIDALLGAAALGDIGQHFPDTDPNYLGADSLKLLTAVVALLRESGFEVVNVDSTVALEKPKLLSFIPEMCKRLSATLEIEPSRVSVKATTTERLGFVGKEEGVAAFATCSIRTSHG